VLPGGLIAFRDVAGIGVLDPASGHERMVLALPPGCRPAGGGQGPVGLAGPVWAPAAGPGARLYFWLTDWGYKPGPACNLPGVPPWVGAGGAVLVEADPFNGSMSAVAAAPNGLPCQAGEDLVAVMGALAFTDGGCDEPQVQALALPLRPGAQPRDAPLGLTPAQFASGCAVGEQLLGQGPGGRALFQETATQCSPPPPSLQWWLPPAGTVGLFSPRPPRRLWASLRASAVAPGGAEEAFALGSGGAGTLDLRSGAWSPVGLLPCRGALCPGALSVSYSPSGNELAVADNGDLVVVPARGAGPPRVLAGGGAASVSWSGPVSPPAAASGPAVPLGSVLERLWAPLAKFWGEGEERTWRVEPAAMSPPVVQVVSLPEPARSLLVLPNRVALASGTQAQEAGSWWRSDDGGRSWSALNPHCAELQSASSQFLPCQVSQMAALGGGVVLARGDPGLGLWRSTDWGRRWQRQPFPGSIIEGGPWAAGKVAYLLVVPAVAGGQVPSPGGPASLLTSTDAGQSWSRLLVAPRRDPAGTAAQLQQFFVLGPGRFAELYRSGPCSSPAELRVSADNGQRWSDIALDRLVVPGALAEDGAGRVVLGASFCGRSAPHYGQGLFTHRLAAGGPWVPARAPAGYHDLYGLGPAGRYPAPPAAVEAFSVAGLVFPSGQEGVAVGSALSASTTSAGVLSAVPSQGLALVWVSRDGGASWSDEPVPGVPPLRAVSCAGPGDCLAAA